MATPVLPYPDMDFTPLDILTAEEMDEIVANVEYLKTFCGGLADGSNLSDGVIQARNINWGSITGSGSIKLGDKLVQWGVADFGSQSFSSDFWATFNRSANQSMYFSYPIAFDTKPVLIMNPVDNASPLLGICYTASNGSGSRSPSFALYSPKAFTSTVNVKVQWIAVGIKA